MNYDATIRELEEKRDFYAAAISALKKIAAHEGAAPEKPTTRGKARGRANAVTSTEIQLMQRMRAGGATYNAIAAALGRQEGTVFRTLKEHGTGAVEAAAEIIDPAQELVGTH